MIKAILFDCDGTLVNSAPGIVKTMEQVFIKMNIPVPTEEAMRATIGLPLRLALKELGHLDDKSADDATELYRSLFPIYEVEYVTVFPEVKETLMALKEKGLRMAIVTSRDTTSLRLIADRRDMTPFFETYVTGADGFPPKPAPDMVLALLKRMNLKEDEVLVVGDTTFDIDMGNSAGCKTVAVTYGNHSQERLMTSHPTFVIEHFSKLANLLFN